MPTGDETLTEMMGENRYTVVSALQEAAIWLEESCKITQKDKTAEAARRLQGMT